MTATLLHPRVRVSTPNDLMAVDALLSQSYPALLKHDYLPSVLVTALPLISRAQPQLLASGSYFVAELDDEIVGAGGWTMEAPGGKPGSRGVGHVRHVVTSHRHTRHGIGRALMSNVILHAKGCGMMKLDCLSTRTAVKFYEAMGFLQMGGIDVPLRPGITLPSIRMELML
ncbi:GNAT family N-acetyltransferase [Primorskyibacter sp. S187A]|uniref:GNAT family N-acetyltransferase n=1 Tax=Primorskyibacter sp. S187A TaxID=3415130 RepID=UPI003C7DF48E